MARFVAASGIGEIKSTIVAGSEDDGESFDTQGLTAAQIARIRAALEEMYGTEIGDAIFDSSSEATLGGWAAARHLLDIRTGFDVPPAQAIAALRTISDDFAGLVVDRERQAAREALERGIINGDSNREVARALKDTFAEGIHRISDDETIGAQLIASTDAWSDMVARTETSRASNDGAMALYQAAGIQTLEWLTNQADNVCDECDAADGERVALGDAFPSVDVSSPPAHASCRCTTIPSDADLGDYRAKNDGEAA